MISRVDGQSAAAWFATAPAKSASRQEKFPYDAETIERRKKDPTLDRAMYQAELADVLGEQSQLETLARKVARGQKLTAQEERLMLEKNPEMLKKAVEAREQAKRLQQAGGGAGAAAAIAAQAQAAAKSGDPLGGVLLAEAAQSLTSARSTKTKDTENDTARLKLLANQAIDQARLVRAPEGRGAVDLQA